MDPCFPGVFSPDKPERGIGEVVAPEISSNSVSLISVALFSSPLPCQKSSWTSAKDKFD
jgi:hypothetical protein